MTLALMSNWFPTMGKICMVLTIAIRVRYPINLTISAGIGLPGQWNRLISKHCHQV